MKDKNVHNLIIEGPDGVGKTTLIKNLFKHYNYRYMCYHRGEISNYIFAKKYNRTYYVTQKGLPFIYILLYCSKEALKDRIIKRANKENWSEYDTAIEVAKVNDVDDFLEVAHKMEKDYEIIYIDTTDKNEKEVLDAVVKELDKRYENLEKDSEETYTQWNKMYKKGCEILNKKFEVVNNQPYINGRPANCETSLQNGAYETFTNKEFPVNLIFTLGYGKLNVNSEKTADFQYIINSKIRNRPEIYDYYNVFEKANLSCITSNFEDIPQYKNFERHDRIFGDEYLNIISKAKATVYSAREVEYLKIQTGRLYEGIIANNIIFVDELSDKNSDMLKAIYNNDSKFVDMLTINPDNVIEKYNRVINDKELVNYILNKQHEYLHNLMEKIKGEK